MNAVNALTPPLDLYIILHFIQLTVDKYDAVQQLHKCSYALKIQDIGAKNAPVWVFVSCIYIIRYHTSRESSITRVLFVPNITSANVILYNSSVNKKLILCYILKTILCVFAQFCREHITFKATAELGYCASSSNTTVFSFWMNLSFERIVWINDSKTHS